MARLPEAERRLLQEMICIDCHGRDLTGRPPSREENGQDASSLVRGANCIATGDPQAGRGRRILVEVI